MNKNIEIAIKKSIEGGYMPNGMSQAGSISYKYKCISNWYDGVGRINAVFMEALFWQCLGKTMGWQDGLSGIKPDWYCFWHRFIDALAEGKSADSFFEELFNNKN